MDWTTQRTSGILLHPTSLPGRFGIGDLGPQAYRFVDFLVRAKQTLWQILPLGPTGYGNSPYMSLSAFGGNALLISISLEGLREEGLLETSDFERPAAFPADRVDFGSVITYKFPLLQKAFRKFLDRFTGVPGRKGPSSWMPTSFCATWSSRTTMSLDRSTPGERRTRTLSMTWRSFRADSARPDVQ